MYVEQVNQANLKALAILNFEREKSYLKITKKLNEISHKDNKIKNRTQRSWTSYIA